MTKSIKTAAKGSAMVVIGVLLNRWHTPPAIRSLFEFSIAMKLSVGCWVVFGLYWSIAARDSAPTQSAESTWSRQLHLVLVNGALLLLILSIPGLTHRFLPASDTVTAVGLTIQAASLLFAVWSRKCLGSNWSGEVRIAAGHSLVRSGPYRFVRHPIYTAVVGMYVGTAIISGEVHAPLALLVVALAYRRKLRLEEQALTEVFGQEYLTYQRDTWAVVPLLF